MPSKNQIKQYIREVRIAHDSRIADSLGGGVISGGGSAGVSVLSTVPATVDGGFWYDPDTHALWVRQGNYEYQFTYARLKYKGNATAELVAYLPFDGSVTADAGGNEWTAVGTPYIDGTNAISINALQLDGSSYLQCDTPLIFGERDLTFDCYAYINSSTPSYSALLYANSGTGSNRVGEFHFGNTNQGLVLTLGDVSGQYSENNISVANTTNRLRHFALTYTHANTTTRVFVDGTCVFTKTDFVIPRMERMCYIGSNKHGLGQYRMKGTIDEWRFFDGVALWTSDFTPPTASDYE